SQPKYTATLNSESLTKPLLPITAFFTLLDKTLITKNKPTENLLNVFFTNLGKDSPLKAQASLLNDYKKLAEAYVCFITAQKDDLANKVRNTISLCQTFGQNPSSLVPLEAVKILIEVIMHKGYEKAELELMKQTLTGIDDIKLNATSIGLKKQL